MTSQIPDQELDYHYSPSRWSHRMAPDEVVIDHIEQACQGSKLALWTLDSEQAVSYGETDRQKFDVFDKKGANKKGVPMFVYFHGGYWQHKELERENSSFMAVPLCNAGATVIPVSYDVAPDVTVCEILVQIKKALKLIIQLAKDRNSKGIYLCGHSAGAHIAAMMLKEEFEDGFDSELIKGAVLVSGVYDLRPLVKTSINEPLGLTEDEAWQTSPMNYLDKMSELSNQRHVIIAVGEFDSPEFRRQGGEMEKALRDRGVRTNYVDVPDTDHFSVINKLDQSKYQLTKECLRLMDL